MAKQNESGKTAGSRLSRPPTTQEAVLLALRRSIATGELRPGERLYQDALAEQMGVSRVPVREALNVLRADGQLEYSPHRGYWVSALSLEAVQEINLIRSLLETEAIRLALAKMSGELPEQMEAINNELAEANAADDVSRFVSLNHDFHFALFDHAELPRLRQHIEALWKSADVYRTSVFNDPEARLRMLAEHQELIEACRSRDPVRAVQVMDSHRNKAVVKLSGLLGDDPVSPAPGQPDGDVAEAEE
jgi:DNA-binding GntR family transcriptional regulator